MSSDLTRAAIPPPHDGPGVPPPATAGRKEFRTLISLEEARAIARGLAPRPRAERVPLAEALGRVLASEVTAGRDVPPFTRSTMDGWAVRSADTAEADEERPVELRRAGLAEAGRLALAPVLSGEAIEIATGAPLPGGANAVVKIEHTDDRGDRVLVRRGVAPGENVMAAGDDLMLGDAVLLAGTPLGPREIGVLAATGEAEAEVWAAPRVGILSTGDELRPPGAELAPGQIHDINAAFLAAAVSRAGGEPVPLGIVRDDRAAIEGTLLEAAAACDLLLTSGSTSAGAGDVIYEILERRGRLLAHGVRIEPGKPTALARLGELPVVGLPGNPASAAVVFEILVAPLIRVAAGREAEPPARLVHARLATEIRAAPGRRLLRMVGVIGRGDGARAYPIEKRSGAITLLASADGYVEVPEDRSRIPAGETVEVALFEDAGRLPDALFMGSHCLGLRPLFAALSPLRARSVHVGSLGGVRAVERGVADAAGLHLLDPGGEYNVTVLGRMGVREAVLVRGYRRRQGWIVPLGNPAGIGGVGDLVDRRARIVNRVGGSGTRILLEDLLEREASRRGVTAASLAQSLPGFDVEAASHSAVAAAVRAGLADAGLGIEAAAALNGLGFVPVAEERYDFLLPSSAAAGEVGAALRRVLGSREFREELERIPGYGADPCSGEVVWTG